MTDAYSERLFSYGTLRNKAVQLAILGRTLEGTPDVVMEYRLESAGIDSPKVVAQSGLEVHSILVPSDDPQATVEGVVFAFSEQELRAADDCSGLGLLDSSYPGHRY